MIASFPPRLQVSRGPRAVARILAALAIAAAALTEARAETTFAVKLVPTQADYGWNGFGHDRPLLEGGAPILRALRRCDDDLAPCDSDADCTAGTCTSTCDLPGATCELQGPVGLRRCVHDLSLCTTNADCVGASPCVPPAAPPMPMSVSNTPTCVTSRADGDISGTYDVVSGDSVLSGALRWRVFLGIARDMPCPRCGAPAQSPQVGDSFACEGGPRDGQSCTVDAVSPQFGGVSYACPPSFFANVSGTGIRLRLPEITTATTLRTAAISCIAGGLCTDDASVCTSNADCTRCTDDLSACSSNADCAAGSCASAPAQPISCGYYCHCGFCDDDPNQPCFNDSECGAGETCSPGNATTQQQHEPNACADLVCGRAQTEECCAAGDPNCGPANETALIGHCSDKTFVACLADADCTDDSAGTCVLERRSCFGHTIERSGAPSPLGAHCVEDPSTGACATNSDCAAGACVEDTSEPAYVALACIPRTGSAGVSASYGVPGPAAITFDGAGALVTTDCGNGIMEFGEDCDGSECCSGACTPLAVGTPCTDDGDICTDDTCNAGAGCSHTYDESNDPSCVPPTTVPPTTTTLPPDDDVDDDGLPNEIDPCFDGHGFYRGSLLLRSVGTNTDPADDDMVLKAEFGFPTEMPQVDPTVSGMRILIYSDDNEVLSDIVIPPGQPWRVRRKTFNVLIHEARFILVDPAGTHAGIRRIRIDGGSTPNVGFLKVRVVGRNGTYPATWSDTPLDVAVIVGDGASRECGDSLYPFDGCTVGAGGQQLRCRFGVPTD